MRLLAWIFASAACLAQSIEPGTLPRQWRTSGPGCAGPLDWQIHEYNPDLYILREPGCSNYEKPFLYLIFGEKRVLLEDTGAGKTEVDKVVLGVIEAWAKKRDREAPPLTVIHSHSHGDHKAGDELFKQIPRVTFIAADIESVKSNAGIENWPEQTGLIDLGGRVIDVIGIPGHDVVDVALYDRRTGILLTGDTLYPGRLYIANFAEYVKSIDRLVEFTATRPVAHVLGTHIEQSRTPFVDYKIRTIYQPDEAALELARGDLLELQAGLATIKDKPRRLPLARFTISPRLQVP